MGVFSSPKKLINSWEIQRFKLSDQGIKDLVFDIKIEGQSEEITKMKTYGKVTDLHYRVYWLSSGDMDVQVMGLGGKWRELRSSLKSNIFGILEVLFPTSLFKVTRGYELSTTSSGRVKAVDKSFQKPFQEMFISFSKVGALSEIKSKSALGTQILTFVNKKQPAVKNAFVTQKIFKKNFYGPRTINSNISISYGKESGYFLPKGLDLTTELSIPEGASKEDGNRVSKKNSRINFSNFSVNKNLARSYFKK